MRAGDYRSTIEAYSMFFVPGKILLHVTFLLIWLRQKYRYGCVESKQWKIIIIKNNRRLNVSIILQGVITLLVQIFFLLFFSSGRHPVRLCLSHDCSSTSLVCFIRGLEMDRARRSNTKYQFSNRMIWIFHLLADWKCVWDKFYVDVGDNLFRLV